MEEVVKDLSSFVKQVVARLKGDGAEAIAARNERKGRSAFKQQVSNYESKVVDAEEKLDQAKAAFEDAIYKKTDITNGESYVRAIADADFDVRTKEAELKTAQDTLAFYEKLLKERF